MAKKTQQRKIQKTDTLTDVSPYELEGTLKALKEQIEGWIANYGEDAYLNWDPDYWPQYQDSPSPQYDIKRDREETDDECEKRIKDEQLKKDLQEAREKKEFERLQKKFAGKK